MNLIHITTEVQFNVAKRVMAEHGKKPFEIQPRYYGPCYLQDTDNYLVLRQGTFTSDNATIISFEDFIKEIV